MVKVSGVKITPDNLEEINFAIEDLDTATTTRTLRNIKKSLIYSLKNEYKIKDKDALNEISNFILNVNGLNTDNFDFVKNIETLIDKKLNDVSIDDNSNKNEKTIKGLMKEVETSVDKAIGFDLLYRVIKELYGKNEAKRLTGLMYDYSLGLSDSANILSPYCWALDASKIPTLGREFGQLPSGPSKRLSSYISALSETVHQLSSHLAGAIAIGTFFLDISHVMIYKDNDGKGYSLEEVQKEKVVRKYIENEMQQFVHSVNHLSRNGIESPFTNVSIFDKPKLRTLINDENLGWYFPKLKNMTKEEHTEYILDYIVEIQNIYMKFFEKGNPLKNGEPYRFPVSTINISKNKDENGNIFIEDKQFLKSVVSPEIFRYNIFTSEGTKVASCCRLISNSEMIELAEQSNSFGGSSISLGSHRVITTNFARIGILCETYEDYFNILEKRVEDSAKILKAHKQLITLLTKKGLQPFISNGWIQLSRMFSTFGILGIVEGAEILKSRFEELKDKDVKAEILTFFNEKVLDYSKQYEIIGNIEQIPAESYAIRLANVDNKIFNSPYKIYSNQFIPLWDQESSVWERMDEDGKYNQLLTGGGIVHLNIGEKLTNKQIESLIEYSIKSGCEHFSLNPTYSICKDGHVNFGKFETCPVCQETIVDYMTRVVGFFTNVQSWKSEKVLYDFDKRKIYANGDFDK